MENDSSSRLERAERLPRAFYERHTLRVARDLLGKLLVRQRGDTIRVGRVVETEAYHGHDDQASHASRGMTPRNAVMFGPPGHAYVYQIYGVWFCLNAVTCRAGFPAAVLIRAVLLDEAREGAGPGKLCRALGIDKTLSGVDLVRDDRLSFADDGYRLGRGAIATGPRIGVDYAGAWAQRPWRLWVKDHPEVSRPPSRRSLG
jgi:DNA-3-methyladenine glycosylase